MAYIYLDRYGWMFCEALAAASRRGVAVRVIIDAFGAESFAFGGENPHSRCRRDGQAVVFDDLLLLLKGSGVAVGYWYGYSSVNGKEYPTKNHTKAIVTDSKYAVIGDRNIGIEYFVSHGEYTNVQSQANPDTCVCTCYDNLTCIDCFKYGKILTYLRLHTAHIVVSILVFLARTCDPVSF